MQYWPSKDPSWITDYGLDWAPALGLLGNPTITLSVWSVVSGDVTLGPGDLGGSKTIVRVSGGTTKTEAVLKNLVTLSDGRRFSENVLLEIR